MGREAVRIMVQRLSKPDDTVAAALAYAEQFLTASLGRHTYTKGEIQDFVLELHGILKPVEHEIAKPLMSVK